LPEWGIERGALPPPIRPGSCCADRARSSLSGPRPRVVWHAPSSRTGAALPSWQTRFGGHMIRRTNSNLNALAAQSARTLGRTHVSRPSRGHLTIPAYRRSRAKQAHQHHPPRETISLSISARCCCSMWHGLPPTYPRKSALQPRPVRHPGWLSPGRGPRARSRGRRLSSYMYGAPTF
jgi:hypothetical protein